MFSEHYLPQYRPAPEQMPLLGASAVAELSVAQPPARGAAAGLVTSKTTPIEKQPRTPCTNEGDRFTITFCREENARKRLAGLKKGVWFAGRLHGSMSRKGHRPDPAYFVTLTYVGVDDWKPEHLTRATDAFRRYCKRVGVPARYLWVSELQKRGAVHYHLVAWLPRGVPMPKWDEPTTAPSGRVVDPFWPHGMTNVQKVKTSAVAYLMKYLSKNSELHVFPKGLRLFGVGGLDSQSRSIRAWSNLPEWLKRQYGVGELQRVGSSFVDRQTGEVIESIWRSQLVPSGIVLTLLRPYPEAFHVGPYSTFPRP